MTGLFDDPGLRFDPGFEPSDEPADDFEGIDVEDRVFDFFMFAHIWFTPFPHGIDRQRYHELMDRLRLYRLALGQPNPDSYLQDLEKNGFLKTIDTRSLYLNLFPFRAVDHQSRLQHILEQQDAIELLLSDAEKKASLLEKTTGIALLKGLVGKAVETVRKNVKGDYPKAVKRPPLIRLIEAICEFVNVHDKINDRVPNLGYQDDIARLKKALGAIT